jgi:hypothetical protein
MKINGSYMFIMVIVVGFHLGCSWRERKTDSRAKTESRALVSKDSVYKKNMLFSAASFEVPARKISLQPEKSKDFFTVLPGAKDSAGQENVSLFVPYGVQYELTLPIDIKIYLNCGSLLVFNPVNSRSLQIKGEALFDIGKHPGTVKVGDNLWINAEANTRFYVSNYKDYSEEPFLVTGVINGAAELQGHIASKLNAGKQILIDSVTEVIGVSHVDSTAVLKWTKQEFFFDEVDAYKILKKLSRWYNVSLDVPREAILEHTFRVIKKYDEPLDSFLESMNRAMNQELFIVKDNVIRLGNIKN